MTVKCEPKKDEDSLSFEEIAEMNRQNEERIKRERLKANKSITKSLKPRSK